MEQVKSRKRVTDFAEVFTNQREVDAMCDLLPPEMFMPDKTFLEPTCGEGVFVLEILRRKFANCRTRADYSAALRSVYAFELQADNVEITIQNVTELCEEHFRPTKDDLQTINDHIIQADAIKIMKMMNDPQLQEAELCTCPTL